MACACWASRENDVSFSAAKLFFAYGLGNAMTFPLWTGSTAILDDRRPTPDTTFEIIERFKPTLYFGVPTLYAALLVALDARPRELVSIRACVSAGEALPADIFRRWKEKTGTVILDGIGSTECLHIFIGNRLDDHRPGTSGKPVPGYEARILDERRQAGGEGRERRACGSAPSRRRSTTGTSPRRRPRPWSTAGSTPATPIARTPTATYVYDGRNDDMLKVGGIWCSPIEIESCLISHPAVLEAAIVGQADADELIKPKAIVVLKQAGGGGAGADRGADGALQDQTLAPYKYPRWVEFVPELPKTATGKIQRFKLRA